MWFSKGSIGYGAAGGTLKLWNGPYDTFITTELDQIAVGTVSPATVVPTPTGSSVGGKAYVVLKNASTGGQVIRVGSAPNFGTPNGFPLFPGESITIQGVGTAVTAIANLAGAIMERFIVRTSNA